MTTIWCIFKKQMANSSPVLVEAWSRRKKAIERMYTEYMMKSCSGYYCVEPVVLNKNSIVEKVSKNKNK